MRHSTWWPQDVSLYLRLQWHQHRSLPLLLLRSSASSPRSRCVATSHQLSELQFSITFTVGIDSKFVYFLPMEQCMWKNMRHKVYWSYMGCDVYTTVTDCWKCARNCVDKTWAWHLNLSPVRHPLKVIAMDILSPLKKTTNGNQFEGMMNDRYFKLTRAVPTSNTTVTYIANIL